VFVSAAAAAALRHADRGPGLVEVAEEEARGGVEDECADGDVDAEVLSAGSRLVLSLSRSAVLGDEVSAEGQFVEGVEGWVGDEDDVAALATIAAVWSSARDEFLSAETDAAVAAVACPDVEDRLVNEHEVVSGGRPCSLGDDVDFSPRSELHDSGYFGVECVVAAAADVEAWTEACSALSDDDSACGHALAAESLYSAAFRDAIATVAGRALPFLMRHLEDSFIFPRPRFVR